MASFLSSLERQAWLASVDRASPVVLEFAQQLDDLCETALRQTGRDLPVEHAVARAARPA